jgi:recombination protein RecR
MKYLPKAVERLIVQFDKLPGIGPKTSEKLVFHLLGRPKEDLKDFADSLLEAQEKITTCPLCFNYSDITPCSICADKNRTPEKICVVSEIQDVQAIEKLHSFDGVFHVLHGVINPPEGMTPDKLRIRELHERVLKNKPKEIILALNHDINGETTSLYLAKLLKPTNIKITRLAKGLPSGSEIEYTDDVTLSYAFKDRKEV